MFKKVVPENSFFTKVLFNKLYGFSGEYRKSLIAFYKIGITEISYYFVKNTIILLYAVKKNLINLNDISKFKTNAKLYIRKET